MDDQLTAFDKLSLLAVFFLAGGLLGFLVGMKSA